MYRAVLIADIHLRWNESIGGINSKGYSVRTIDKFNAIKFVCEYCNTTNADLFILGDLFNRPNPNEKLRRAVAKVLSRNHNNTYIIGGNHDTSDNITFSFGSECILSNNIHLIDKPTILRDVGISLVPWNNESKLPSETTDILFGHLQVAGAKYGNEYLSDKYLDANVFKDKRLVRLGHVHKRQIYDTYGYIGALRINGFGECNNETGFTVITIDGKKIKETFVNYPDRVFVVETFIDMSEDEIIDSLKSKNTVSKGCLIKLKIQGDEALIGSIGKRRIKNRVKELGAIYVKTEYTSTNDKIADKIDIVDRPRDAFDEFCRKEGLSKEYVEYGKTIMEKVDNV